MTTYSDLLGSQQTMVGLNIGQAADYLREEAIRHDSAEPDDMDKANDVAFSIAAELGYGPDDDEIGTGALMLTLFEMMYYLDPDKAVSILNALNDAGSAQRERVAQSTT